MQFLGGHENEFYGSIRTSCGYERLVDWEHCLKLNPRTDSAGGNHLFLADLSLRPEPP